MPLSPSTAIHRTSPANGR